MSTPAERLVRLRRILGFSQRELASEFKVSYGAVGSWEAGNQKIPGSVLKLLEIYETGLKLGSVNTDKKVQADDLANELVETLTHSIRVTDAQLLRTLRSSLTKYVNETFPASDVHRRVQSLAMKQLIRTLGDSRGLPMKVAQVSSFLDPHIPLEIGETMELLQYQNRSMPYQKVCEIFQEEFGRGPQQEFAEFSRRPIARASIGQVHQARLHDGTRVAVKVQYPEIRDKCDASFRAPEFLEQLSLFVGVQPEAAERLFHDFHQTILSECDYELEAKNQDTFHQLFSSDSNITVPKVFFAHSRKQILTTEWIEGQSWGQFKASANQADRNNAAQIISRFYAQSVFSHGIFQADPHPGNYLFVDGKVAILDFGRVRRISASSQEEFRLFHRFLMAQDREQMRSFLETSESLILGPNFDFQQFWESLIQLSKHLNVANDVTFSRDTLSQQRSSLKKLGGQHSICVHPDFFWAFLFVHQLMVCGRADLGAVANWGQILKTHINQ